ncbi:ProQ/FinO family protein [Roseibium sp. RKSG952]|uniref:ProQ/FinO family protein n=1 Tax=Roseibium sp. RKSG952 TaxID=2529384 RepID=UPI0012BCCE25|nr:ProQ/FinO family protein [Roseibium sp. RKSG952]MTH95387.1 hypothetical protein [Roseibium sp. RKSG952]
MKSVRTSRRFRIYKTVRAAVSLRFPNAFPRSGTRPPLKIGIVKDLLEHSGELNVSRSDMRLFLSVWIRSGSYQKGLSIIPHRFDLDGTLSGEVSPSQRMKARDVIRMRRDRALGVTVAA